MNPARSLRTARLAMAPVSAADLAELIPFKADPGIYAQMLGGVRSPVQTAEELSEELSFWAATGVGMWTVRTLGQGSQLLGLTGMHSRTDGRGMALRFAFRPEVRGQGLAREAAGAALRYAHDRASIPRVIAVARESNLGSRTVLGAIGMRECARFDRSGDTMLIYESLAIPGLVP